MRVGGERELKVDVRIIAATNRDLETLVREGNFRKDLYYRLKVMVIEMPPLRDRPEDILLLTNLFIEENNKEHGKHVRGFTDEARKWITAYHWPGNVRELRNVIERAMILTDRDILSPDLLPFELKQVPRTELGEGLGTPDQAGDYSLDSAERKHISKVLSLVEWNKSKASKTLGISRATLREKIRKYGLSENIK
jgi:transcriptional regulator with PAS, ATPase and Fis domain